MARSWLLWAGCALIAHATLVSSVHIVYDETLWTKQNWATYKIDPGIWGHLNPADDIVKQPELRSLVQQTTLNSLDGPMPRRAASAPLCVSTILHTRSVRVFRRIACINEFCMCTLQHTLCSQHYAYATCGRVHSKMHSWWLSSTGAVNKFHC